MNPATPVRPLPGAFAFTPAATRPAQPVFRVGTAPVNPPPQPQQPVVSAPAPAPPTAAPVAQQQPEIKPIERAARTINDTLTQEARYPDLDSYITQGISSDYDIPRTNALAPYQQVKTYNIPDRIFEQYNEAQVSTMMGLFAELSHAWVVIDNALYLWDYTLPTPELIGFEDQPNIITAVKLVKPRPKVFVDAITHLLVVATTTDMILIGVAHNKTPEGINEVALYQTNMRASIRGLSVRCIEGSAKTGRIFFGGEVTDDVYELTYQQEERWFGSKCGTVNHVNKSVVNYVNNTLKLSFGSSVLTPVVKLVKTASKEHVVQMVVDDSRNLLYTLSNLSAIRVFHMKNMASLDCVITRSFQSLRTQIGHMVASSDLITSQTELASITPISATEASRLNLMAVTNSGCRIFLSATSGGFYSTDITSAPTSMQVHHVKFPPGSTDPANNQPVQQIGGYQVTPIDTNSRNLTLTTKASRFAPGYFLCFVRDEASQAEKLFLSSPDSGRIARPAEPAQIPRFYEKGQWIPLGSNMQDVGLVTAAFGATGTPLGFGNELAVQFDQPTSEFAILTNTGVHTIRRRRLVDVFAAAIKAGGGEDGLEAEMKNFMRMYGRSETCATALAVACQQASDVTHDYRVTKLTDQDTLENARKAFIEYGGKPTYNENLQLDNNADRLDNVRPSPRHDGVALYISRLLRSVWKAPILKEGVSAAGGFEVSPTVDLPKLQSIQRDLTHLQEFLGKNKSFIEGLAGPEALGRVATPQEEIALRGEHRAMDSLVKLLTSVIEGISFVLVLFDEKVEEIVLTLPDNVREQVRQLTFESLFAAATGRDLAKELVKAIVNRNIEKGSNVDTVAEALRRRCGSFCSADDVVIFKAQEKLRKAQDAGANSEIGRQLLNDSLNLFQRVASSLSMEHLQAAIEQYVSMSFFAGAIRLSLRVAQQLDRGNKAVGFVRENMPETDPRRKEYEARRSCYALVHRIILAVDAAAKSEPEVIDGQLTPTAKRKIEAYEEINNSEDEVFQTNLYDWYLEQGWSDRLLEINSNYVIEYLTRKSEEQAKHADLLWRYYAHHHRFFDAASVQLQLAKSGFDLTLEHRVRYLSQAKSNASTRLTGLGDVPMSRQSRQELLREASDLLDLANIQSDILDRMRGERRLDAERKPQIIKTLNGQILPLDDLYGTYADQAGYYDLCLLIYQVADHRDLANIRATWQNLLEQTHEAAELNNQRPWEAVAETVRELGARLNLSDTTFNVPTVLPLLETYAFTHQRGARASPTWVVDVFLDLGVAYDQLVSVLESIFYNNEAPFVGRSRRTIANHLVHVVEVWFNESTRGGGYAFGGVENAAMVQELLRVVEESGVLERDWMGVAVDLRARIAMVLR
ncbi:Nucleoporin [Macrophomina phaseolina MS6]|uniref:Nucleoporin n=2 Tax=Macrophomina phaseolina TaxID=35725 RepID=K2RZH0_MACPH|nr:Nucleoporin [Macrophomina phaseolina MS6]KAH7048495.1 putative non-repetitive nucleoporin [Macrophomina phaseolina]